MERDIRAIICDLDGVITDTAVQHARAWKLAFDRYNERRRQEGRETFRDFSIAEDYPEHIDGIPRYDGVELFLQSRNIDLPYGAPEDEAGEETIRGIGNWKNEIFHELIETEGVAVRDENVAQLRRWRAAGLRTGIISSSRNCKRILEITGLEELFDVRIDGVVSEARGIPGKPAPDIFLAAARDLKVAPAQAMVVEDSLAGIAAGAEGGFGLVVAIEGAPARHQLLDRGADRVVKDLREVDLDLYSKKKLIALSNWKLRYNDYQADKEPLREALLTLGNGYFATRGAAEETTAADPSHYPGTYLAGGYNRLTTKIAGERIENEDLVNWPDWTLLKWKPAGGDWVHPDRCEILEYHQELNLLTGLLERRIVTRDTEQRETELLTRRFVSMHAPHLAGIEWRLTPRNWSGELVLHSALDGSVTNDGVARYRDLNGKHLEVLDRGDFAEDGIFLRVRTTQSRIVMAQAARTTVHANGAVDFSVAREHFKDAEYVAQELRLKARANQTLRFEKIVAVYTSRDQAISEPTLEARQAVRLAPGFDVLAQNSGRAWSELWRRCDLEMHTGEEQDQLLLRLHIFHLLQTYSYHSVDLDTGVPARGWHGEAYRGHIFWDELFIFPFFKANIPELARAVLMYRYRRLDAARHAAREAGYEGAIFPWQSGSNGREESQEIHLNPESGRWVPDHTHLQRHVNSAIAYNIWSYFQATGDLEFLADYGAEMLLEIAKFWAAKTEYHEERDRYEIREVVGPDEYHTQYPDSDAPGLNNNAYTNILAVWVLQRAQEALECLNQARAAELMARLEIDAEDLDRWDKIRHRMYVPFIQDGRVIEQFEGFDKLRELDWERYRKEHGEQLRLDRILEDEGDDVNNYKAAKQADVFMLYYLFSYDELNDLLRRLGYDFDARERLADMIDYYEPRTSHGSTLSQFVHSWAFARSRREASWHNFKQALISDFSDVQGGTTPEGIHLGAMVGTVNLILVCYTGLEINRHLVRFDPKLPKNVRRISFRIRSRKQWLDVELSHEYLRLYSHGGWEEQLKVTLPGHELLIEKGQTRKIRLGNDESPTL